MVVVASLVEDSLAVEASLAQVEYADQELEVPVTEVQELVASQH